MVVDTVNRVTVVGFGRRLLATLYDGFLLAFGTFVLAFLIGFVGLFIEMFNPDSPPPMEQVITVSAVILSLFYYISMWAKTGQTIGKTLAGIKVVSKDGTKLGWGKATLRYVGFLVSALLLALGFLWIGFDKHRQGWHDKIAGTYVTLADDVWGDSDNVEFVTAESDRGGVIPLILWLAFALLAPALLLGGLWALGPVISRTIYGWIQGLV